MDVIFPLWPLSVEEFFITWGRASSIVPTNAPCRPFHRFRSLEATTKWRFYSVSLIAKEA